jgi:TonB family protein
MRFSRCSTAFESNYIQNAEVGRQPAVNALMQRLVWLGMLAIFVPAPFLAAVTTPAIYPLSSDSDLRNPRALRTLTRAADFNSIRHISSVPSCQEVKPPEALTTPDPLLTIHSRARKVKVSFIVGTDGRVHSPLILESAGVAGDHHVLQAIRTWRYRPATCNGVPAETEGNVEFSSR